MKAHICYQLSNLIAMSAVLEVDMRSVRLSDLHSLAILRADIAKLGYSMKGVDDMVKKMLRKALNIPNDSVADLEQLIMVRSLMTDSEVKTCAVTYDGYINWVIEKLSDKAVIERQVH